MRGHGTALAHLLFLAARRRPHEFGLHGCLLRSHPLTLPTAPISFNFLAVNDIAPAAGRARPAPRSPARGGWGAAPPTQTLSGSAPDVGLFAPQRSPRGRRRTVWGQRRHLREYLS